MTAMLCVTWARCLGLLSAMIFSDPAQSQTRDSASSEILGRVDSVWTDIGFPIQQAPGGQKFKPLFAYQTASLDAQTSSQPTSQAVYAAEDGIARNVLTFDTAQPSAYWIGVEAVPADDTLRSQLNLLPGIGLVVTNVLADSPAAKVGLKQHDVLLSMGDKALTSVDVLNEQIRTTGEKSAGALVRLMRAGKEERVEVTPEQRQVAQFAITFLNDVSLSLQGQPHYWIGVEVVQPDEILRSHLSLPEGQGIVVTNVVPDSPAAKAGLKQHDILLVMGDKPLSDRDQLIEQIQATGDKPAPIKLIRAGKPMTIEVTPDKQAGEWGVQLLPEAQNAWRRINLVSPGGVLFENQGDGKFVELYQNFAPQGHVALITRDGDVANAETGPNNLEKQLEQMINQINELRKAVEELQKTVQKDK